MLNEVADGVWVRRSEWVGGNAVALRDEDGYRLPVVAGGPHRSNVEQARS